MAKRENKDARDGINRFVASLRKRQSPGHDAKSHGPDRSRQNETVLVRASTKCDSTDQHRKRQADLVNNRPSKESTRRREQAQKHGGRDTMNHAKAGKPHGYPV